MLSIDIQQVITRSQQDNFKLSVKTSLPVHEGIVGVYGASGAGKSTLLKCLAGFGDGGQIDVQLDSQSILGKRAEDTCVVMQMQEPRLFPHLTVEGNLAFVLKHSSKKFSSPFSLKTVAQWCDIESLLDQPVSSLSGGQKQRVSFARTLLSGKPLVLLDEPFSALDWHARKSMLSLLSFLHSQYHIQFVLISHSLRELALCCRHIIEIENGQLVQSGDVESVISRINRAEPESVFSRLAVTFSTFLPEYMLDIWTIDGCEEATIYCHCDTKSHTATDTIADTKVDGKAHEKLETVKDTLGINDNTDASPKESAKSKVIIIDANKVSLSRDIPQKTSMLNLVQCTVQSITESQTSVLIELNVGQQTLTSQISKLSFHEMKIQLQESLFAQFKAV